MKYFHRVRRLAALFSSKSVMFSSSDSASKAAAPSDWKPGEK